MTTVSEAATTGDDSGTRNLANARALRGLMWRWLVIAVLVGAGFWRSIARILEEISAGTESTHVLLVPACALILAIGAARRRVPELPIFDRQTDVIVGVVLAVVAVMLRVLVVPRYSSFNTLVHPDVAAAYVFAMSASVFLFGLRRTAHYWQAWGIVLIASPAVVRLLSHLAGGGDLGFALVLVPLAALCVGIGTGTSRTKAAVLSLTSVVVGYLVLALLNVVLGLDAAPVVQILPVVAALAVAIPGLHRMPAEPGWERPSQVVAPREGLKYILLLVIVAAAISLVPLPPSTGDLVAEGPPGPSSAHLQVPPAWHEISQSPVEWAPSMFGPGATMNEQLLRSGEPRSDWDEKSRPRMVMAYTITANSRGIFGVFPVEMTFDTRRSRTSPAEFVELPHGIKARFRTVVDDSTYLTWSILSFLWCRTDGTTQRIMLLSIDNHDYDASFPQPRPSTLSTAERLASILMRGNSAVTDEFSERKDLDMLSELGGDIVEAQWPR